MAQTLTIQSFDLALAEWLTFSGAGSRWSGSRWYQFRCESEGGDEYSFERLDHHLVDQWDADPGDRWLYFARGASRDVKVGISQNPELRAASLRSRLLLRVEGCDRSHERAIHSLLGEERLSREESPGGIEWFRGPGVELLIAVACARAEREAA